MDLLSTEKELANSLKDEGKINRESLINILNLSSSLIQTSIIKLSLFMTLISILLFIFCIWAKIFNKKIPSNPLKL